MKGSLWLHGAWAVAAAGAFVLGSQWSSRSDDPDQRLAGERGRLHGRADGRLGVEGGETREGRATRASERSNAAKRALSGAEIRRLGETFRKTGNLVERRLAFAKLLEGLTPENAKLIREHVADLPADSPEFREFHYAWGAVAGGDAVSNGADTPKDDMAATLAGWASVDPAAAMNWLDGSGLTNDPAISALLAERGTAAEDLKNRLSIGMVYGMSDADPHAAANYVLDLAGAGNGKVNWMMGMVAEKMMRAENTASAAMWAQGLPEGPMRAAALGKIAGSYASEDPRAAATWLTSLDGGDVSGAMQSTFASWTRKDPVATGEFINGMEPSISRDWAINGYATNVAAKDPAGAIEWADAIADPAVREQTLVRTGQLYFQRGDRAAAEAWLEGSGLSDAAQRKVLSGK